MHDTAWPRTGGGRPATAGEATVSHHAVGPWTKPLQISENGAIGSPGGTHPLAMDGDTVRVVWWHGERIYLRSSTDGGVTWGQPVPLTDGGTASYPASLVASGQSLLLIWPDNRDHGARGGNLGEVYIKSSADGGRTWSSDQRIAPNMHFFRIGTATSGSDVHVAWNEQTDPIPNPANYRWYKGCIWYKHSADGGKTWGPNVQLTARNDFDHGRPAIAADGQFVHVAWIDGRDANKEVPWDQDIYYRRSADGGATWGPEVRMNNDPGDRGWHPQILATGQGRVCLIYEKGLRFDVATKTWSGDSAMYARVSGDNGKTWAPAQRISSVNRPSGRATHAKSFACGRRIHLTWTDAVEGAAAPTRGEAAFYATSPDGGLTWSDPERVCPQWNDAAPQAVAGTDSRAVILLGRDALYATVRQGLPEPRARQ